ncbi:hypothetical protein HPB52_023254 [Rhipicephalus sanguineus]|uniref:Fucosyltransferase n=1 Tax=Rhipicephalus sanguineus TaxID=34632 RepID=A0A9D4PZ45_RHISA|nr:hypothetical protein HPB52_023254 [Rhipicephalus sanguineus]
MAEAPVSGSSSSPHEDDVQDSSPQDSPSGAAAAQEAVGHFSLSSSDVIQMEDLGPEAHNTPPEYSSPPQQQSEPTERSARLLFVEHMGEIVGRIRNHLNVYRWTYFLFIAFFVVFTHAYLIPNIPYKLWHREPPHPVSKKPPPRPPVASTSSIEYWHPWRERLTDHGFPRILLWNTPATDKHVIYGYTLCHTRLQHAVCDVTAQRRMLSSCDAIVFDDEHLTEWDLPTKRKQFQYWVFWSKRHMSPETLRLNPEGAGWMSQLKDSINWTMASRDDADIVVPYKTWRCGLPTNESLAKSIKQTSVAKGNIAWIVSGSESRRFEQKALPINDEHNGAVSADRLSIRLFSSCGREQCLRPRECIPHIAKNYHFIVVSLKTDCFQSAYELIYEAFHYNVVPVVLAPPNATLNVPPHSVVVSSNLPGAGELSAYLRYLLRDRASYDSYFAWKNNCSFVPSDNEFCTLCRALWATPAGHRNHYDDIREWWTRDFNCQSELFYGLDDGFGPEV